MNKQDLKIQTCVLRVNIHCEGCKNKIKKKLQKVDGVYKVNIDVDQHKVTVSGNVDPSTLINKLEKAGKHAELWGPQKGPFSIMSNNQFKNFQIENINGGKDSKPQKGFKDQNKGGVVQAPQQMMNLNKGSKDVGIVGKDRNSVRFQLPEDEEDDEDFDDSEEDDDEFDDESDDDFGAHQPPSKGAPVVVRGGHGPESKKATPKGHLKGKDGANNGGNGKRGGGGMNMFIKGMLGKAGGKSGKVGNTDNKAGSRNEGGQKNGKNDGLVFEKGKNGAAIVKGATFGGDGKTNDSWNKKMGEKLNFNGGHKLENKQQGFDEVNANHRGGGGGGGRNAGVMGHMGDFPMGHLPNFPTAQGLPASAAMNFGHLQGGGGQGNPYNNQQYMANMMMMMNQQGGNRHDAYHPLGYGRPPPPSAMSYGPPPMAGDRYTHIFSDENTDSCSIM